MLHMRFFFFFKQKTAYEMRISDWSSDVCSSDLAIPPIPPCTPLSRSSSSVAAAAASTVELVGLEPTSDRHYVCEGAPQSTQTQAIAHFLTFHLDDSCRFVCSGVGSCTRSNFTCPENAVRSEEHTSELQSLMRTSYAVFFL